MYTNKYAAAQFVNKPSLESGWFDVTPVEMYKYIALLFYMSIVRLPNTELYWCTESFFHGNWARAFMSKKRYKQISAFLKISNYKTENNNDKLAKMRFLHDYVRRKSIRYKI